MCGPEALVDGSLERERYASYTKLQRELRALAIKQDKRLRADERKRGAASDGPSGTPNAGDLAFASNSEEERPCGSSRPSQPSRGSRRKPSRLPKIPFSMGVAHYDEPPPGHRRPRGDDRGRRVPRGDELRAFIEVEDGKIVDYGHLGGGHLGVTKVKLGPREVSVPAIAMPTLQPEPEVGDGLGALHPDGRRPGMPAPRHVHGKPFFQISSALAWTTRGSRSTPTARPSTSSKAPARFLATGSTGGSSSRRAASSTSRSGTARRSASTPWGKEDSEPFVTAVETAPRAGDRRPQAACPRSLGPRGGRRARRAGRAERRALPAPGRSAGGRGRRRSPRSGPARSWASARCSKVACTATLRAVTPVKVVSISSGELDPSVLQKLAASRREAVVLVRGADGGHDLFAVLHPHGRSEALSPPSPRRVDRTSYRRSSLSPRSRAARVTR